VPIVPGDSMKVYFGPQGGTHLEVGANFEASGLVGNPVVVVTGKIVIDGVQVGNSPTINWTALNVDGSYALAYYVQVSFSGMYSDSPPIGEIAELCMDITLNDGRNGRACADVLLSED
jgi:hypothetical protein